MKGDPIMPIQLGNTYNIHYKNKSIPVRITRIFNDSTGHRRFRGINDETEQHIRIFEFSDDAIIQ